MREPLPCLMISLLVASVGPTLIPGVAQQHYAKETAPVTRSISRYSIWDIIRAGCPRVLSCTSRGVDLVERLGA
jgi:hypothetical protein